MASGENPRIGRRAVLGAALGGAAAAAAAAIAAPSAVLGANSDPMIVGQIHDATSTTGISCTSTHGFFAGSTGGDGLRATSSNDTSSGVFAFTSSANGYGVYAYQMTNGGKAALAAPAAALWALQGNAPLALKVEGKAKFSRSGKATVLKNKTDVDITVPGGLASNSVVHATLQTYRSGVAIAAVRKNYPTTGKARIYLTRVASTSSSTYVGWFVAEY